jgi:large subunit ribosomal protein L4
MEQKRFGTGVRESKGTIMEINIVNMKNEPVEKLEVPESIAEADQNKSLVYEMVRQYQAGGRQGTAATKTRGLVSGSGRKLWRQKGTGRARIGSIRSPLWRHGGTVFGPQPRNYSYSVPAKKQKAALRSVLAQKLKGSSVFVLEEISLEQAKTSAARKFLTAFKIDSKTLFVDSAKNKSLRLSVRNLGNAKFSTVAGLNIVDAMKYKNLVISKDAFSQLTKMLAK